MIFVLLFISHSSMKKSLLSLLGVALLSLAFGGIVNAQEATLTIDDVFPRWEVLTNSYTKLLNNYDKSWGYPAGTTRLSWSFANDILKIESPTLEDADLWDVPIYRMYFSPYRLDQLKWDEGVNLSAIIMKEAKWDKSSKTVEFEISLIDDDLDTLQPYYGFIVPLNDYDLVGTPSPEICFQFDKWLYSWWNECNVIEASIDPVIEDTPIIDENPTLWEEELHNAGGDCIWMDMAHLTHTISNNTITIRWTAVDGDVVQFAVFDPDEEAFKSIGAVKMSDEKFSYPMTWNWEYNFKITNGCKQVYYKADGSVQTSEPKIVPPATGPAENILIIAIAAIVIYGAYTLIFRKNEN